MFLARKKKLFDCTGEISPKKKEDFMSFDEARQYVHMLHLRSRTEWESYCRQGLKPYNMPRDPYGVYSSEWISWKDWLGYTKEKVKGEA